MFDRDGFKKYVGTNSGSSYVNGLDNIEKIYGVDINAELQKDKCVHLLVRIDSDKKKMTGNDRHNRQNWFSHLKKYIEYKGKRRAGPLALPERSGAHCVKHAANRYGRRSMRRVLLRQTR